jgi:hypothetical protein
MEELDEIYNTLVDKVYTELKEKTNSVYEIFKDFFGEDFVDLQNLPIKSDMGSYIKSCNYNNFSEIGVRGRISLLLEDKESADNKYLIKRLYENEEVFKNVLYKTARYVAHPDILIYFPKVTVTNEHNKSRIITKLYVKIHISCYGLLTDGFKMNRAEYTEEELDSDYLHSHAVGIPRDNFEYFVSCCTGNGPIVETMNTLYNTCDYDIWKLFCVELSKYVTVESLRGVPYHKLEEVTGRDWIDAFYHNNTVIRCPIWDRDTLINDFARYYISNNTLKFNYSHGRYNIGIPFLQLAINMSNSFINWYNNKYNEGKYSYTFNSLKNCGIVKNYSIINNKVYIKNNNNYRSRDYKDYIGTKVCDFKGNPVYLNVVISNNEISYVLLLQDYIVSYIVTNILKFINYKYGRTGSDSINKIEEYL